MVPKGHQFAVKERQPVKAHKLDLFKVASLSELRREHDLCKKASAKTYNQHLEESKGRNDRIFAKYGCLVYVSEFDRIYGKDPI